MKIEQLYEKCLSQASYYIEHKGVAAVIDPIRDIDRYLELAKSSGSTIKYIFETHFHADFVSGHLELARLTGAEIVFGPGAKTDFAAIIAEDGTVFYFGDYNLTLLHTPGHTLESVCYLLKDKANREQAIFTGDTLFLGDVGRPDLAQDMDEQLSQEELAGKLFDSLRNKIMPLPDHVIIYPGHGAGSACGKNMSNEKSGDLGQQKRVNYALNEHLTRAEFIEQLCHELSIPPAYFPFNVALNTKGYEPLTTVIEKGLVAIDALDFKKRMTVSGVLVLDTRSAAQFSASHVPGAINIGLDGSFAPFVGAIIPSTQQEILLVCDLGREAEAIRRLARIGYHQCIGYLNLGMNSWIAADLPFDVVENMGANEIFKYFSNSSTQFVDVRNASEYLKGSVQSAINIPLSGKIEIGEWCGSSNDILVYCAGGYRSMIFISLLKAKGIHNLVNVIGGYSAIQVQKNVALTHE